MYYSSSGHEVWPINGLFRLHDSIHLVISLMVVKILNINIAIVPILLKLFTLYCVYVFEADSTIQL